MRRYQNVNGNILDEDSYNYGNSTWGDKLTMTKFNGQTITYDTMGNPTSYLGKSLSWQGKQLTSYSGNGYSISYSYNEDGLRLKKTVNNTDTNYYYNGSVLMAMTSGTTYQQFSYDSRGNVVSVNYNGTEYYYLRNAQGDIVKLIDGSGTTVVEYAYDSWGKKLSTTGTLATTLGKYQPFRYRGYVYDEETRWYYLQSRYYDPAVRRFISADVLLSTGQGVLGHNAFAYCLNSPISLTDNSGKRPIFAASMADSGGSSEAITYGKGEAISITVTSTSIMICAYVNVSGPISANLIISGIEETWSGNFDIDGSNKRLITRVITGKSSKGKSLKIKTKGKLGVSHVRWGLFGNWSPRRNGKMTLFTGDRRSNHLYTEQELKWVAAHEFGHLMGVDDYYTKYPNSTKNSIFNNFGDYVTSEDVGKVLYAFINQTKALW